MMKPSHMTAVWKKKKKKKKKKKNIFNKLLKHDRICHFWTSIDTATGSR